MRDPADDPEHRMAWSDPEWYFSAGAHYSDLSAWLREVAGRCRLPNPQWELLTLLGNTSGWQLAWSGMGPAALAADPAAGKRPTPKRNPLRL